MMITNFASGELGALLNGRTDLPQYYQGASKLLNFDVIPTGGIERRRGTERIARLDGNCRLIPFILDALTSFVLEFRAVNGVTHILFWKNGKKLLGADGKQIMVSAHWASLSEIREIQYAQNYDQMIFVQKDHAPFSLQYKAGEDIFVSGEMSFDFSPDVELDDDYDYISVLERLPETKTASGYCISGGYLYVFNDEKGLWEKDEGTTEYEMDEGLFTKDGKFPSAVAFFNGRLFFASTRNSQQKVWASASPDLNGARYNDFSTYVKYVTVNKVVKEPDIHFFTANTDAKETAVTDKDGKETGEMTLTGNLFLLSDVTQNLTTVENLSDYYVTGDTIAEGTKVVSATWDETTSKGTVTLSSAVTGAGKAQVYSIQKWLDRSTPSSNDYEFKVVNNNMTRSDNAFFFEVASDQNDAIKWLASSTYLVIGTESSTYVLNAASNATAQQVVMNGRNGTDAIQATCVDRAVIYLSQGLKGIREYYWNNQEEAFRSNNIALLSPQMLSESAACEFDFMTNPYARLLVTREDGTVSVLLYEKNNGVLAWSRFQLAHGKITSVAVTRGESGCDLVYLVVKVGDGEDEAYYFEKLDLEKEVYLDSWNRFVALTSDYEDDAVIFNKTKGESITVRDWLELTYPADFIDAEDEVYIGYVYESLIRSMPVISDDPTGKKRIVKLLVRFLESWRPKLLVDGRPDEVFTDFKEPFSGIKEVTYPGESKRDVYFTLSAKHEKPCTVLGVHAITD